MARLVNLTLHDVVVLDADDQPIHVIVQTGSEARLDTYADSPDSLEVDGVEVPIHTVSHGAASGLPDSTPDTYFVVSRLLAVALPERRDLLRARWRRSLVWEAPRDT